MRCERYSDLFVHIQYYNSHPFKRDFTVPNLDSYLKRKKHIFPEKNEGHICLDAIKITNFKTLKQKLN